MPETTSRTGPRLWFLLLGTVGLGILAGFAVARSTADRPEVIVYCAQDQVFAEPILAGFTRQTGIRVKPVFDSEAVKTVGLANRLLAERAHPVCDVFWGNEEFRTRQLAAAGVFRATNGWAAFGQRSRRLVVNSERGTPGQDPHPASLLELTNACYRGRVSIAFPLFGSTATHFLVLRAAWGESNWRTWCQALAANHPFLEEGNSHVVKRVARGEAWIGLTDSDDIEAGRREGLPVASLPSTTDLLLIPNSVAVIRDCPHAENAGRLFDYLRSDAVRKALLESGAIETETAGPLPPDWSAILANLDVATAQVKQIFRPEAGR